MSNLTLYGPIWSAYTRTARLALAEKEVNYNLKEVDFSNGVMPAEHFKLHPFGKVPVLAHGNYVIYETSAICRYIDKAFSGPSLQPTDVQQLGRMAQLIAILDAYLSEEIRMRFVNELLIKPRSGLAPNKERVESSRACIQKAFIGFADLLENTTFFVGQRITLADLHAAPLFDYLDETPGGDKLINTQPKLRDWWSSMKTRSSVISTKPDLSVFDTA